MRYGTQREGSVTQMPEGDTIYRTAARLRPLLEGQQIMAASSRDASLPAESLVERSFYAVQSRGKHLLKQMGDGRTLHSHLGMHGSWQIYRPGQPWQKPKRWAALVIEVTDVICVCFSPKSLELLTETQLRRHPHISRLGPDLLDGELDYEEALARFRVHNVTPIGQAVMNQSIVCGIGNVYKSEVLFLSRANPFVLVSQLSDDRILRIVKLASELMAKNLDGYPRRTRFGPGRQNHWVYGRRGKPCFVCSSRIQLRRQGDLGRTTFWCPECQGT